MHPPEIRHAALDLIAAGVNDCEIARRLGLPRTTVRDMRWASRDDRRKICPRCWHPMPVVQWTAEDYAELLGLYLGLLRRCFPTNRVGRVTQSGGSNVIPYVHNAHLSCVLPQAGAGKKHDRPIALEPWQKDLVAAAPWSLLRGLIRSDGCVFVNRTGRYEYLSYHFANVSQDILDLFEATCRSLGLRPRRSRIHVRLNRRADVALLLEHVGLKT
jgi:hypothetical protein